ALASTPGTTVLEHGAYGSAPAESLRRERVAAPRPRLWAVPRLPDLALSLATLAAVGFSLSLCAYELFLPLAARQAFLVENKLGASERARLLVTLVIGVATPLLIAGGAWLRH